MEPIVLTDSQTGSIAKIAPELGWNCYEFTAQLEGQPIEVLDSAPDFLEGNQSPSGHGIPVLFPFPNRIRAGKFQWEGKDFHLPAGKVAYNQDNAIHGFCLDRPWRVVEQGPDFATGEFRLSQDAPDRLELWPADFVIQVRYQIQDSTLRSEILISNPDEKPLPWGFGTHAYFKLPLGAKSSPDRCLLQAPASEQWDLIECMPTGNKRPIPPEIDLREGAYFDVLKLDDVLTGLPTGGAPLICTLLDEAAGLQVEQICDPVFRELVVYTPPNRAAVCMEPYTCLTDAINMQALGFDAGWQTLPAGETWKSWIEIRAGRIIV